MIFAPGNISRSVHSRFWNCWLVHPVSYRHPPNEEESSLLDYFAWILPSPTRSMHFRIIRLWSADRVRRIKSWHRRTQTLQITAIEIHQSAPDRPVEAGAWLFTYREYVTRLG